MRSSTFVWFSFELITKYMIYENDKSNIILCKSELFKFLISTPYMQTNAIISKRMVYGKYEIHYFQILINYVYIFIILSSHVHFSSHLYSFRPRYFYDCKEYSLQYFFAYTLFHFTLASSSVLYYTTRKIGFFT